MPKVTKIERQKKAGRFNIYVDGKFTVGIGEDLLVRKGLKVGKEIGPSEIEEIIYKSKLEKLFAKALDLLEYRPRSKREIRNKLWKKVRKLKVQRELRSNLIERTLQELEDKNYLNDSEFADWWVKERIRSRPRGKMLLRSELIDKGVDRKIIERVLGKYSEDDAVAWAEKLVEKREHRYQKLPPAERKKKLTSYLRRRGFSWSVVNRIFGTNYS